MLFPSRLVRLAAAVLAVSILAGCGGAEERKAKYMERGKSYFEEKNYEKATVEFKNVLQIDPKTAAPYYYLGRMAEQEQNWRKAFGNYSKAVELDPELLDARIHLGRFYVLGGELDKAEEEASAVLAREAGNAGALTLKASIHYKNGKIEEAAEILRGVLAVAPGDEPAAVLLAGILGKQDKADESLKVLESASAANPESAVLRLNLAGRYIDRSEDDKAEAILAGLINDYPEVLNYRVMLASYYVRKNLDEKAESVLRKTIADAPDDIQRYLLLVNFYKDRKGIEPALAELEVMRKAKPELPDLVFLQAALYVESDQAGKAEDLYRGLIGKFGVEPEGLRARTSIATLRANEGKNDEAVKLLDEVLAENAQDKDALMLKGRLQLRGKQFTEAITTFRSLLKDQPDSAEVMMLLASAHQGNGEPALASELLSRAVQAEPANVKAKLALAQSLAASGDYDNALLQTDAALKIEPENIAALRIKAETFARQGNLEALEEVLTLMEKTSPDSGLGAFGKGRLYRSQKKYDEAIAAFLDALKREPGSILTLTELVNTYLVSGNPDAAEAHVRKVLDEQAGHQAAHALLALVLSAKKDFAGAEAEYLKQLELNPKSAKVYLAIAELRVRQGNVDGAEQIFLQGLGELPGNSELLLNQANFYSAKGDLDTAAKVYQQGITDEAGGQQFEFGLASLYERQKKFVDAAAIYEKILARDPDNLVATNNLAVLLSEHKDDEQSRNRAFELALKLADAEQPALRDTLGWIYYQRAEYDKAAEVLSGVVEKAPDVGVFRYHLGMTYYKQGDFRAATEILSKAVAENMQYEGVDEARRVLAEMRGK